MNDPETHELGPILKTYTDLDFLGEEMTDEVVVQIAECVIDPITRENLQESIAKKDEADRLKKT